MPVTLDAITLPEDLIWVGEFEWSPIVQTEGYSVTGALLLDSGIKLAGRPINLVGSVSSAWIDRGNLKNLYALMEANAEMLLTLLDNRTFNVRFDHKSKPIQSEPIIDYSDPNDTDKNTLTLNMIIV